MRHARAASPTGGRDDHERALVDSGRRDATAVASLAAVREDPPERLLCSTARRALETAERVCVALGLENTRLETDERLYLASPRTLLAIIAEQDALDVTHLMIVGHNPGLEELAVALDARAPHALPTAGLCRFARRASPEDSERTEARLLFETRPPG